MPDPGVQEADQILEKENEQLNAVSTTRPPSTNRAPFVINTGSGPKTVRPGQGPVIDTFRPSQARQYTPRLTHDQASQQLPNYARLSGFEQWLMRTMPGVAAKVEPYAKSPWGQALSKWVLSPAGKVLSVLDIPVEGVERATGFATQWLAALGDPAHMQEFKEHVGEAWYAGSLAADMANLPQMKFDENGGFAGYQVPQDNAGYTGLIWARKRIAELGDQGMEYGDALNQARDEYYNNQGALSLRAQLNDTYFHILADPLNVLAAFIKPIESIQTTAKIANSFKYAPQEVSKIKLAARALEQSGQIEEAAKMTARVVEMEKNLIGRWDKFALMLSGGTELKPTDEIGKWGQFIRKVNPFGLTPESRAYEMLTVLDDGIQAYVIAPHADDPIAMVRAYDDIVRGALGPEHGHAFITPEGSTAQAFLSAGQAKANDLGRAWQLTSEERELLYRLADELGEEPGQLLARVLKDDADVVAKYGQRAADDIKRLEGMPVNTKEFAATLTNEIADSAAHLAITRYGVQSRGLILKTAAAMKSAESLAFLRLNPGFPVRNFLNNEMTMIARGLSGVPLSQKSLLRFWDEVARMKPKRLQQAFTMADNALVGGKNLSQAEMVIYKALRGDPKGVAAALDRFSTAVGDINLGPIDMARYSQMSEESSSLRSFTKGYQEFWGQVWRPGKGYDKLDDFVGPDVAETLARIDPDLARLIENKVSSGYHIDDIRNSLKTGDVQHSMETVNTLARERAGYNIENILEPELMIEIEGKLLPAIEAGDVGQVRTVMDEVRKTRTDFIQDMFEEQLSIKSDEVRAIIAGEGPKGFIRVFDDIQENLYNVVHRAFAQERAALGDEIANISDPAIAARFWERQRERDTVFFDRFWKQFEESTKALRQGAKDAGMDVPKQFTDNISAWRTETRKFFRTKHKLHDAFFEARKKGEVPKLSFDEINARLDDDYNKLFDFEYDINAKNDALVVKAIRDTGLPEDYVPPETNLPLVPREEGVLDNPPFEKPPIKEDVEQIATAFATTQAAINDLRRQDKLLMRDFWREVRELPLKERDAAWKDLWRQRFELQDRMSQARVLGNSAIMGDEGAIALANLELENRLVRSGWGSLDEALAAFLRDPENPALREFRPLLEGLYDESLDKFGTRGESKNFVADLKRLTDNGTDPPPGVMYNTTEEYWNVRGYEALDHMEEAAVELTTRPPLKIEGLPDDVLKKLDDYLRHVEGQMSDARYGATRFGEYRRDTALLNYNRRFNYNTYLGAVMPFEFWFTQSIAKWVLHSVDRPFMAATFLRMKKLWETAGTPEQGIPSRLKQHIRIPMPPGMESWMGDAVFVDPFRVLLPFNQFLYPFEQMQGRKFTVEGRVDRKLEEWADSGQINEQQLADARNNGEASTVYQQAQAQVERDSADLKYDAFDFVTLFSSPHAPLMWAKEIMDGTPENIGPFTPLTRFSKQVSQLMGVDSALLPHNIEATIRKQMGLPAFDKWDDYRVERMLSNMDADGEYPHDEIQQAMIDQEGELWQIASDRAADEYAVNVKGYGWLDAFGILPASLFPTGEAGQRALQDDFSNALEARENGDESALADFFEAYPEYESRLALFKTPEQRLHNFLVAEIWERYMGMNNVNKREVREALGDPFQVQFLDKDTESIDDLSAETLGMWLHVMGGDTPGKLELNQAGLENSIVKLTDPDVGNRVQIFYNTRDQYFDDSIFDLQSDYFKLAKGEARENYLAKHPELGVYWDWRRDFLYRNPDIARFLTDDPDGLPLIEAGHEFILDNQPFYSWNEWQTILPGPLQRFILAAESDGEALPPVAVETLEDIAEELGLSGAEALDLIRLSLDFASQ